MNKRIYGVALVITLIALSLVLAACSQAPAVTPVTTPVATPTPEKTTTPEPSVPVTKTPEPVVEIATNSTKSSYEQQQETIQLAIADGTYVDEVTYRSPGGQDHIQINVTVKDDVITAASVTPVSADRTSTRFINSLNGALPDLVVGKKITELQIPRNVAGSSLTTAAFKQHLNDLVAQY